MNSPGINPRAELVERLRFEALLADLLSKFVNLPAGELDREIEGAQRRGCELQAGGRYCAEGPSGAPEWGLRAQLTFLFP